MQILRVGIELNCELIPNGIDKRFNFHVSCFRSFLSKLSGILTIKASPTFNFKFRAPLEHSRIFIYCSALFGFSEVENFKSKQKKV